MGYIIPKILDILDYRLYYGIYLVKIMGYIGRRLLVILGDILDKNYGIYVKETLWDILRDIYVKSYIEYI